ncbi:hypothetical protein XBP1_160003 [Xenorhabdus bovienii str. puntauvense]|uniref:NrS-1 polymerase-like helicase domain-containing protein n=1 Tax=Xenorhabdus bovienii str. puntauvense TaxID=1398201 RepID=A0A077NC06_XENBV|nr:primase-helicase family protein [Xenorhabdus bovienii]CDG95793.1 hypothetical protein XBP1_160003 [Xenorhabdus bovienii str. puntauvense]
MEIRYSWGTSAVDGQPREMSVPDFDTFEQSIRDNRTTIGVLPEDTKEELDAKKRSLPYIWHAFKTGATHRRRNASAGNLYYLPLDLDGVTQNGWECIREILSAYRGFAYTTASHEHPVAKGEYRIRIILAPSRAVSPAEKQPLLQALQTEIMSVVDLLYDGPAKWDDSVYRPAQMVFLPDERAQFWSFTGQAVDVDTLLATVPVPIEIQDDTEQDDLTRLVDLDNIDDNTFEDLRSALWHPRMLQHAENYPSWAAMGNRLAWFKDTDHEEKAKALWVEWSAKADKGDPEAAINKWEQLTADRTGFQSIFSLAQKAGWMNPGAERFQSAVACVDDFEDVTDTDNGSDFADIDTDMTGHFLERFIYVVKGDQVCDLSRPPYRSIMDMKSFKNLMAPYQFPPVGKGQPMPATRRWLEHSKKLVAETTGYQPGKGRIIQGQDGWLEINEFYLPEHRKVTSFEMVENIFLKHMEYLIPDEKQRLFFIARLAWMVQRPERRCPVTVLHISILHGTGRGWVIQLMEALLGSWNCTRAKMDVVCKNQFHDYLYHSLLCTVDEVKENIEKRYSVNDQLRDLLTEPRFEVNNKYGKKMTMDIFTGFLFFSNHIDALVIPEVDRRIAVFGGPDFLQGDSYFKQLYQALKDPEFIAQVYWYLMSIDLDAFDWQRAPETEERKLMIESGRSDIEKALLDLLENPLTPAMTYQQIVTELVKEIGLDSQFNDKQIAAILRGRGLRQAERLKIEGATVRQWILEKNCKFERQELKTWFETCEKLQNSV